jgi:glycosyltransferase involved in cell wall biosynthesis
MLARMVQTAGRARRMTGRQAITMARAAVRDYRYPLPRVNRSAAQRTEPTVYFCVPDFDVPSGGVRVTYRHADLLNAAGLPAFVLHRRAGFRCTWFDNDTQVTASDETLVGPDDIVVMGELAVPLLRDREPGARFVVFNQNPHLTWQRVPEGLVAEYASSPDLAAIVVVSQHSLEMVRHVAPDARVARVHNSIDPRLFHPGEAAATRRIAYMPRGGRDEAAQVLSMLRARGHLERWEVVALQGMSEREVAATLRTTTIFLSFAYHEGFGLPAAEAMACGAYAVGFHGFAGAEFMRAEFSTPIGPGDVLAMARAVENVMQQEERQPGWCRSRGEAAARYIAREYSPERERDDVVGLYRSLLVPTRR